MSFSGQTLAELCLTLDCEKKEELGFDKGSVLQGVIMQEIPSAYARALHEQGLKPYSQYIRFEQEQPVWHIRTLNSEAYQNIIGSFLSSERKSFYLEHGETEVAILRKECREQAVSDLFRRFYEEDAGKVYQVEFLSPTSFKSEGRYQFYPDMRWIYQSLMHRFDQVSDSEGMFSEETFEQLSERTQVTAYSLYSVNFHMEGVRLPAFMGQMTIRINGTQTMANFAKLLFSFGNFSGVGIKTAAGMGSVRFTERRGRRRNDRN